MPVFKNKITEKQVGPLHHARYQKMQHFFLFHSFLEKGLRDGGRAAATPLGGSEPSPADGIARGYSTGRPEQTGLLNVTKTLRSGRDACLSVMFPFCQKGA